MTVITSQRPLRPSLLLSAVAGLLTSLLAGCSCSGTPGGGGGGEGADQGAAADGLGAAGDGAVACVTGLKSITLSPSETMVTLTGSAPAPVGLTATGTFDDGHSAPLDGAQLGWKASRDDDTPPGMVAGGSFVPFPDAGGTVTLTAFDGCGVSGSTTVKLALSVTLGSPADPTAWTGTPSTAGAVPSVVYPSDQTRFPRNIYRTLFQWRTAGHAQFRLTFTGPGGTVEVFTDGANPLCAGKNPAAGCWEADERAWSFIAGSNAGATVTWTVDALDTATATPTVRRAAPVTLGFSKRDVAGAIFYWSTTSAGVRRANIRDQLPEDYITGKPGTTYASPADQVKCVACHVVSRDGKYLVAPVSASSGNSLWVMDVTKSAPPDPKVKSVANTGGHGFATISPDDSTVVAAWGGKMWTVDRATGAFGANIATAPFAAATHPDWSPDNSQLVFAAGKGDAPGGAALALLPYVNPGFGTATTLVAAGGLSNLFPMFSPDGKWIAYSRGKGGHGDLTAQLFVVAGKAGGVPMELVNANRVVSNVLGNGQTENSQPTWAPPGDLYWIAFNSQRAYGVVSPAGTQQIWVAAVDPAKLAQGGADPSFPAFRLQFQGLAENNHRAFWTLDVRDPPPDGGAPPPDLAPAPDSGRMCVMAGKACDPSLDTCCDPGYLCDTLDDGLTYSCVAPVIK